MAFPTVINECIHAENLAVGGAGEHRRVMSSQR